MYNNNVITPILIRAKFPAVMAYYHMNPFMIQSLAISPTGRLSTEPVPNIWMESFQVSCIFGV